MTSLLVIILLSAAALTEAKKPPSEYFDLCSQSDPNLSNCVKESITKSKSKIITGIRELDIVPLDPLYIPLLDLSRTVGISSFLLTETNVRGLGKFQILECIFDLEKDYFKITLHIPKINFHGQYTMDGRIILLPIKGDGDAYLNFTNVATTLNSKLERYKVKGKEYIRAANIKFTIKPEYVQTYLSNLFNGDKVLGEATNRILNENWKETFDIFKGISESAFGVLFKELVNRVFRHYSIDEWLPK